MTQRLENIFTRSRVPTFYLVLVGCIAALCVAESATEPEPVIVRTSIAAKDDRSAQAKCFALARHFRRLAGQGPIDPPAVPNDRGTN